MNSAFLVIDPQRGFTSPEGTLGRAYGPDEFLRIQSTVELLADALPRWAVYCTTVLIYSHYKKSQFSGDLLSDLCVPGISSDCEIDEALASHPYDFSFVKTDQSALSSEDFSNWLSMAIAADTRVFVLSGFLLEHCVRSTAMELRSLVPQKTRVIVAHDLVASRSSKYGATGAVKAAMDQLTAAGIELLSSQEAEQIIASDV